VVSKRATDSGLCVPSVFPTALARRADDGAMAGRTSLQLTVVIAVGRPRPAWQLAALEVGMRAKKVSAEDRRNRVQSVRKVIIRSPGNRMMW
jgi:hypothetical protein